MCGFTGVTFVVLYTKFKLVSFWTLILQSIKYTESLAARYALGSAGGTRDALTVRPL
jgi:hypothetical protein